MTPLNARITSIEGDRASLLLADGQSLWVPLTAIEGAIQVGNEVIFVLVGQGTVDAGHQTIARELLNTLLKN